MCKVGISTMENYFYFFMTALAMAILPGADFAVVTKNTLAAGKIGGQATALGIGSGLIFHTTAVVLGLSAIIAQSAALFDVIKYVGAIYLFYIGITTFLKANQSNQIAGADVMKTTSLPASKNNKEYFGQGVLTNVLNPKASIFYLTLLPQFVTPGQNPFVQLMILGFTAVFVVTCWFLFLAYAFDHIRSWLNRPAFQVTFQRITGIMLITLGIKLALARR